MSIRVDLALGEETDERIQKLAVSMFPNAFRRLDISIGRENRLKSEAVSVTAHHPESGHSVTQSGTPREYAAVKHPDPIAEAALQALVLAVARLEAMIHPPKPEMRAAATAFKVTKKPRFAKV